MTARALAARYVLFAILATAANLLSQRVTLALLDAAAPTFPVDGYWAALAVGTGVGLVIKYVLDKRWIFADTSTGLEAHSKRFSLYLVMGLATTVIFWGTETLFWLTWQTQLARELGAVLGLSVGYVVKYRLDRRFVFDRADEEGTAR